MSTASSDQNIVVINTTNNTVHVTDAEGTTVVVSRILDTAIEVAPTQVHVDVTTTDSQPNIVEVSDRSYEVVTVNTLGPQGPKGDTGEQGPVGPSLPFDKVDTNTFTTTSSIQVSGSFTISGSSTFTNIGPAVFSGSIVGQGVSFANDLYQLGGTNLVRVSDYGAGSVELFSPNVVDIGNSNEVTLEVNNNNSTIKTYNAGQNVGLDLDFQNTTYTIGNPNATSIAVNPSTETITIIGNLEVFGTASITYTSASTLDVGTNTISVNVGEPAERFGGLIVYDSGSFSHEATASLLWDSLNNKWIYQNASGSMYSGGMLISGPRNSSGLGNEVGTTSNALMKGQGGDHITSSGIFEDASGSVTIGSNWLYVSSSGNVGIGTASPSSSISLDVSGSIRATAIVPVADLTHNIGTTALRYNGVFSRVLSAHTSTLDLIGFNVRLMDFAGVTRAMLNSSNNFLIGTTTDAGYRLDVNGTTRTGLLTISGSTSSTGITFSNSNWAILNTSTQGFAYNGDVGFDLYSSTGTPIRFFQTGVIRLAVAATTGNVLINTSTDSGYKLDVSGNARVTSGLTITGSLIVSGSQILAPITSTPQYSFIGSTNSGLSRNPDGAVGLQVNGTAPLLIYTDSWRFPFSSITLKDSSTGNTGLAFSSGNSVANSPTNYVLIANSVTGSNPRIQPESTVLGNVSLNIIAKGTGSVNFPTGSIGIGTIAPTATLHVSGSSNSALLRVDSPASSSILFVSGSGRVGIGTSTPTNTLDIQSTTTGSIRISGSAGSQITLVRPTAGLTGYVRYLGSNMDIGTNGSDPFRLNTANVTRISISETGLVGIGMGTLSPTSLLQVRGSGATSATTTFLLQNSTPTNLLSVLDNGQVSFTSPTITLAASQSAFSISPIISASNVVGGQYYGVNIAPTFFQTTGSQTETAFRVAATFTQSSAVATGGTNIIADFGSTSAGSQLTVTDVTSGSIYMVNDVSGIPIIEATSNWDVNIYDFPNKVFEKTGTQVNIYGTMRVSGSFILPLSQSVAPQTGSAYWSGSLLFIYDGTRYRSSSFA